ncbi:uncharacterized protein KIAA1958-like [Mercenaria mercenaria]|uniref:uncharacterized protein KIAA1958-like n=1 Tax=Mercenaria mercenaria TaxID=6596 RepID=UPI001E1DF249|nr:uncharacterized protein KIAA1958-like [Mercenaria mercenaria]
MDKISKGEEVLRMLADDLLDLKSLAEQEDLDILESKREIELVDGDVQMTDVNKQRFATVEDGDTDSFIEENKNKNTSYQTKSDLKIFSDWAQSVGELRPVETIPMEELDSLLARFYLAVRKRDGSEYEPDTISAIQNSLDRHLKENKVKFSIKRDEGFSHSNRVLEPKRKSLKSQGKGNKKLRADPLTAEEIEMLHKQNILGNATPKSLLRTVWINNGVFFGLRGRQDHTNLLWGDIELKVTSSGREYLEFIERSTKTTSGQRGAYRKVTPKAFATEDENCPVKMYKTYTSHRPSDLLNPDSRFYLQLLKSPSGQIWYSHQAVG